MQINHVVGGGGWHPRAFGEVQAWVGGASACTHGPHQCACLVYGMLHPYSGSAVCRAALRRGWEVTSIRCTLSFLTSRNYVSPLTRISSTFQTNQFNSTKKKITQKKKKINLTYMYGKANAQKSVQVFQTNHKNRKTLCIQC